MFITVIVADDCKIIRDGVKSIIRISEERIRVIDEAANGKELLEIARTTPAVVYVVDIEMPVLSGIEAIERLMKLRPRSRVVVLSMYRDKVLVERVFRSGVRGYVLKECVAEDITQAINDVNKGKCYLSASIKKYKG
jgi:NarL family two-component system response regulator LiaR